MSGKFITLEGGEGAGKSTQARLLLARFETLGIKAILTREPGGSPGAEALRQLLVKGEARRWSALSETLLMYAARSDHLESLIRPALLAGTWVICDRFSDSTRAYQGAGGGMDSHIIEDLDTIVVGSTQPDLVLVLDQSPEAGLQRALARGDQENRFENMGLEFHERLRQAYLQRAELNPDQYRIVAADQSVEQVEAKIMAAVIDHFPDLVRAA
jgi:dTMP kinase